MLQHCSWAAHHIFKKCAKVMGRKNWQGVPTLKQAVQGGCGVSIHADIKNPTRHSPEAGLTLSRGFGLHDMQRCLPASTILWFASCARAYKILILKNFTKFLSWWIQRFFPSELTPCHPVWIGGNTAEDCNQKLVLKQWPCLMDVTMCYPFPQMSGLGKQKPTNQIYSLKNMIPYK